jgi:hypothetical protein
MSRKLYLECNSGISGDMTVAALIDLGADIDTLKKALYTIPDDSFSFEISRVTKSGIDCCDFNVKLKHDNHDHDMEYLHGHSHEHTDEHSHEHHHEHRGMAEITSIIDSCHMTEHARYIAKSIFSVIAEAESKAHNVPVEEVHFHEVGAIDSIVDIIAVSVCFDNLGINEVIIPKLCEGCGTIRCQHGILPVPVPATTYIAERYRLNLQITEYQGEFVTPTGAAIAAVLTTSDKLPEKFKIIKTGMGAGKRNYELPSILRAMILDTSKNEEDVIFKLESNIDDCTGENLGYVMELLFNAGALDVSYTPIFMKKNRPAYQINVICNEEDIARLEDIIFHETTTIGIRRFRAKRSIMTRKVHVIDTPYGKASVKICTRDDEEYIYPEYESVRQLCMENNLSYRRAYEIICQAAKTKSKVLVY